LIRFFAALVGLGIAIGIGGTLAFDSQLIISRPSYFIETLILLVFSTGLIFVYLYRSASALFVQLYLLTMAVKILAYGAYNAAIILKDKPGATENVVFFMIVYFIFTALEILFLYRKVSAH
jgi:fucose 4-O-acetylase-like acetyltransferase